MIASQVAATAANAVRLDNGWEFHQGTLGSIWEIWRGDAATDNVKWTPVTLPHCFNAASYAGSFTINPTTPGPGQTWDTSELATSGAIKVVGGSSGPQFGGIVVTDGNVIPCGTGGLNFSVAQQFFQIELP